MSFSQNYPHYSRAAVEQAIKLKSKDEKVALISRGLTDFYIKTHFTMPLDLKDKILRCNRKLHSAEVIIENLKETASEEAQQFLEPQVLEQQLGIAAEKEKLVEELYGYTAELRAVLEETGADVLPQFMRVIMERECSEEIHISSDIKTKEFAQTLLRTYELAIEEN